MELPKICLVLTGKTLKEDLEILNKYRKYIDMVELRVDHLDDDERLYVRRFPSLAKIPCLLTIRRKIDGGQFVEGESARTILFARALSFADEDKSQNFQFVDFEEDFHIPSLEEATLAFGTQIIRSVHAMNEPIHNIANRLQKLKGSRFEIPKIAFMPETLDDVTNLFKEASLLRDNNHILVAMGNVGIPTRLLGAKLKNFLTYTTAPDQMENVSNITHIDVTQLKNIYHFREVTDQTKIFGITGWPLTGTSSPVIHNAGFDNHGMNSLYIPFAAETFDQALRFADTVGIEGMSVTVPHKEAVLDKASYVDDCAKDIGASNTLVRRGCQWFAYNTDAYGFSKALLEFTGFKNLKRKKVAIIGAGGAAKAIAYAVKELGADACVFNRTLKKAKMLAEKYGFKYASLGPESNEMLKKYSQIIIQTTSKGMHAKGPSNADNDPVYFYEFNGTEIVFDIIYMPAETPIMARAREAGCRSCNGILMLRYQGYKQFELFTGVPY